ncbi:MULTISPECIES: hypothetical protein [Caproicibacterium]|uniref:Uncharacterized protein n=1 Tax=Caproicibacterium argilliputei TaxID=3030016 RepID=A0AA97H0A4_9FIRM|nr:hypothetical protein [Caproicibacterium argilliputei]WOC31351.1 hypothetical protein PXC00_08960 [Caproicibacterium argilliputei]
MGYLLILSMKKAAKWLPASDFMRKNTARLLPGGLVPHHCTFLFLTVRFCKFNKFGSGMTRIGHSVSLNFFTAQYFLGGKVYNNVSVLITVFRQKVRFCCAVIYCYVF